MSEWRATTLDQLVKLQRGHDLPTGERRPGNVPVVGAAGPSGSHDTAIVRAPGVVVGRAGASMGRATYCDVDFWPLNTSLYATDFLGNDPRFVFYLLGRIDFSGYNSGAAQPMLNRNYIKQIAISLPEPREQRAIAAVLGALDDKIAVNERIAATADELAATVFRWRFAHALRYIFDSTTPPSDEWTISTIGASTTIVETGTRPKGGVAQYTSGVPSVGAESIIGLGKFDFSKTKFIPEEFFSSMGRGIIQDRDILVYKDGGRPGDFKPHVTLFANGFPFSRMCINEHVYRVRLMPQLGQEFGYYWLSSEPIMAEMRRRGTGAAIPGMNSTAFKNLPLVIPTSEAIESFTRAVAPLADRVLMAAGESRTLAILRDTLLPQLMSGRLRVKDAEKMVEDHA